MNMRTCSPDAEHDGNLQSEPVNEIDAWQSDVHLGLQICRANSLSLTRLQLAMKQNDRHGVLEAIDRLHDLDTRIGRVLQRLPKSADQCPDTQAINQYIDEQSMAVAFARLELISQVSGPDMLSPTRDWGAPAPQGVNREGQPDEPDGQSATRPQLSAKVLGLILTLLTFAALVGTIAFASGA